MLQLENVKKYYRLHRKMPFGHEYLKAVDGVSFKVEQGESFGIVGESGSGKSTLAKLIVFLEQLTDGTILFDGNNLASLPRESLRQIRRNIQIVFQDAYASLNPRFNVADTLIEPLENFNLTNKIDVTKTINEVLAMVQLPLAVLSKYPSELSGGERQRVCIARTLILRPRLIVFDEATSGLDVTLQSQILNILATLRRELGLTYIFITHNLQILPVITDRVGVMYSGRLVEVIYSKQINKALHPYTQELLAAAPAQHPKDRKLTRKVSLKAINKKSDGGCCYFCRCPISHEQCRMVQPKLLQASHNGELACLVAR